MAIVQMSIHRALGELKTLDARIIQGMNCDFVKANKKSNDKIGGKTVEEFKVAIKGNFDSVTKLIENQKVIKAGIVASNAVTKVTIGGKVYTVADAIERSKLIRHEEDLLVTLKTQYARQRKQVEDENNALPEKLEKYLQSVLGDKSQRSAEDIERYTKDFEARNKYDLIDPCKIEDYIKKLELDITTFKGEVDYILSESNATTYIEVDLGD